MGEWYSTFRQADEMKSLLGGHRDLQCVGVRIADIFRARAVDSTTESFVFELTGNPEKITAFVELMKPLGLVDVSRTGVVAISRGPKPL